MAPTPNAIAGALAHIRSASAQADLDAIRALINTALTSAGSIAQTMTVVRYVLRVPSPWPCSGWAAATASVGIDEGGASRSSRPNDIPASSSIVSFSGLQRCCECEWREIDGSTGTKPQRSTTSVN